MKTIIEKSIKIYGMGHPDVKTVFDLNTIPTLAEDATEEQKKEVRDKESENQKVLKDIRFKSLATISGRKLTVWFKHLEDNKEIEDKVSVAIPFGLDETGVKEFILSEINK